MNKCRHQALGRSLILDSNEQVFGTVGSMYDESWELESLRRSLVMCAPEGPATSLTNGDASRLISRLQAIEKELEMLRSGSPSSCTALHRSPVPTHSCDASALIWDVFWWLRGPLRATTRVRGHPRVGESRKWPSHALCGAFLAGFRVRTPQSAWHAPEDLSRASERIRGISRQMCRNRLLPVVVWVRFSVEALVRQL